MSIDPKWTPTICPECNEPGKLEYAITKLLGYGKSECIDGQWRVHNNNCKRGAYECANGHAWGGPVPNTCECGWMQPWKDCPSCSDTPMSPEEARFEVNENKKIRRKRELYDS